MVAKVLSLNNLSWQRSDSHLHCQMMEERATVLFLSEVMHRKSHTCHFFLFFIFSAIFAGPQFFEIQKFFSLVNMI